MLPALTTKPKQTIRQVQGLTNDSIDAYSNTPLGGGSARTYADNIELNSSARPSPPATSRSPTTGRPTARSGVEDGEGNLARVVRDRKASGEEELSLRTGDVVKVLSSKRTGYLKCEAGDVVGYVPSSYLEFLDESGEAEGGGDGDEAQRATDKQQRKKHRKEKRRHKERREAQDASDVDEIAPVPARSPRKEVSAEDESESPRKSKKKHRKHRAEAEESGAGTSAATPREEDQLASTRSRGAPEDTGERPKKNKHGNKKKRHRDVESSESSDSEDGRRSHRRGRSHRRHRRGGRGTSDSESSSSSSDDSDASSRRRRRRRRRRKQRRSSSEEEDSDSDHRRRGRHSKKRRDKGESDPDDGSRSARKAEKKRQAAAMQSVEEGVASLDVKGETGAASGTAQSAATPTSSRDNKLETEHSDGSSGGRATSLSRQDTSRKDDEGRAGASTGSSSHKQSGRGNLGKQIGDKMRSFLGGSKKQSNSNKNSSGILNACAGTIQGEEGWYEHGENERYYFVLLDGKWSLLYGPMTEDDFEVFSNRVLEQNRAIELPHTYLHKSGYYLNREMRVTKEK